MTETAVVPSGRGREAGPAFSRAAFSAAPSKAEPASARPASQPRSLKLVIERGRAACGAAPPSLAGAGTGNDSAAGTGAAAAEIAEAASAEIGARAAGDGAGAIDGAERPG